VATIKKYCVSCHTGYHNGWANYTEQDYITQGLVQPGRPEASLLINITKFNPYTGVGLMPKGNNGFTQQDFQVLDNWVKSLSAP
jgi:hypothetical protein